MSDEQYVERRGTQCPVCRSGNISAGDTEALDTDGLVQEVRCDACNSAWTEIYRLVEYDNLEVGAPDE